MILVCVVAKHSHNICICVICHTCVQLFFVLRCSRYHFLIINLRRVWRGNVKSIRPTANNTQRQMYARWCILTRREKLPGFWRWG